MFKTSLKAAREMNGYSEDDISVICDVSIVKIRRYEKEPGLVPFGLAKKLKRLYHIPIEQMYLGKRNPELRIRKTCPKRAQHV